MTHKLSQTFKGHPALDGEDIFIPDLLDTSPEGIKDLAESLANEPDVAENFLLLLEGIQKQQKNIEELQSSATIDSLTGIFNRRAFDLILRHEVERHNRASYNQVGEHQEGDSRLCLLYGDLSMFKAINDNYTHDAGDVALKEVAKLLSQKSRSNDLVARLGGDEFVIVLPDCGLKQAKMVQKRILDAFKGFEFDYNGTPLKVGINLGLAAHRPKEPWDAFVKRADVDMQTIKEADPTRVARGAVPPTQNFTP